MVAHLMQLPLEMKFHLVYEGFFMIIQYQLVWRWVSSNYPEEDSLKYCCGLNRQMEAAGTHNAVIRMVLTVPKNP